MKGGYQLIDLQDNDFGVNPVIMIPDVYARVSNPRGKPLLFSNFRRGTSDVEAVWVNGLRIDNIYYFPVNISGSTIYRFVVKSDNTVQYSSTTIVVSNQTLALQETNEVK